MSKNKHKFLTFAALMTGATVDVHFINDCYCCTIKTDAPHF